MKWNVRAFINNPGGAYDPAPVYQFDDQTEGFIPLVGDHVRWDETPPTYIVTARFFDYSSSRCALMIEETTASWPID
ncbi:MAG: hypothetical protein ACK4RZ_11395 [Paracoccaceae bacterium]